MQLPLRAPRLPVPHIGEAVGDHHADDPDLPRASGRRTRNISPLWHPSRSCRVDIRPGVAAPQQHLAAGGEPGSYLQLGRNNRVPVAVQEIALGLGEADHVHGLGKDAFADQVGVAAAASPPLAV